MSDKGDIAPFFLSLAAGLGQTWLMRLLIDRLGADIDSLHPTYIPPIHRAIQEGHYEATRLLIEKGADIASTDKLSRTPLHIAAGLNGIVIPMVGMPVIVQVVGREVETDIQDAMYHGSQLRILQSLLETGIDINVCMDNGLTPLHCAAEAKNPDVIRELINRGADLHARTESGRTPLHLAVRHQWPLATQLLLDAGADPNSGDDENETPLYEAMAGGDVEIVRMLLAAGANVNARTLDGDTPCHHAARWGHEEVVRLLIKHGVDSNAPDACGISYEKEAVVHVLLDAGANVEAQAEDGWNPLCIAAWRGHSDGIRLLLDRGAEIGAYHHSLGVYLVIPCN
ncbi:ankyrin repeat-containing domain protein [Schizophyllum commune]